MSIETISLIATILLAFTGYLITYLQNLHLTRRKERLELINKRLDEFYGPLYISTQVSKRTFAAYRHELIERKRKETEDNSDIEPSLSELWLTPEWRTWSSEIISPILIKTENVILNKAYLIREKDMPECLLNFVAHRASVKRAQKKWGEEDFSMGSYPLIHFPQEINEYATNSYQELKAEQLKLINELKLEANK